MPAKSLTTDEMVQASSVWNDEGQSAREAALAITEVAALLPRVEKAHAALLAHGPAASDPRLAAIKAESIDVDLRHDNIIRGSHGLLTSLALLTADADQAAVWLELRDFLYPDGLASTQKSYAGEAGQGERLAKRLTPAHKKQLKAIDAGGTSLLAYVNELLNKAKRLGELENERASLSPPTEEETSGQALVTARNRWIRAVNALVAVIEGAEVDAATEHVLLGAYRALEKKASTRKGGATPAADDVPTDDAAPRPEK